MIVFCMLAMRWRDIKKKLGSTEDGWKKSLTGRDSLIETNEERWA